MKKQINLIVKAVALIGVTSLFSACGDGDSFIDPRDGQKYKTVKIGDQVWMAEPLNYKKGAKDIGADFVTYTWDSALVACPEGWHLPDKSELESVARDTTFDDIWSSTEKENLTSSAYGKFFFDGDARNKKDAYYVRCVQGAGIAQEYFNNINEYKVIRVGKQIWMKDNLNIPSPQSLCYLNDDEECEKGRFYNLLEAKKICPQGWHLPTSNEAKKLVSKLNRLKDSDNIYDAVKQFYGLETILGIYFTTENKFLFDSLTDKPVGSIITSDGAIIRFIGKNASEIDIVDDFIRSKSDAALVKINVRCIADSENKEE